MPADIGTQTITVKFFDPVDSDVANRIALGVRKKGIYSGGYLTKINDTTVSLSAFDCEIGDGIYQIHGSTAVGVNIAVAPATPYVIIRWVYSGSAANDYMEMLSVAAGSVTANDLIVGVCSFTGSTLNGPIYTLRSNPNVFDLFLKVEPTTSPSMYVRVRSGRVSYGTTNHNIVDQLSPLFVAPGAGLTRVDLIQVNTSGAVIVTQGAPVAIPATPTAPSQGNLVTLAEVTLTAGQTTIVAANITDTRSYVATTFSVGAGGLIPQGGIIMWSGSIASIPTGWAICDGSNGTPNLTDRFVLHADGTINVVGSTGGASTHSHPGSVADALTGPTYRLDDNSGGTDYFWMNPTSHAHSLTVGSGTNVPKYYALAYIMKL